jgi:hypothetical protein
MQPRAHDPIPAPALPLKGREAMFLSAFFLFSVVQDLDLELDLS